MKWERLVWIGAIVLVAAGGFYSGRLLGVRAGEENRSQAAQQFFSQRGGNANGQVPAANGQAGRGGFGGGVSGTVSSVDGSTITLTTRQGATTKVQLADGGTVRKQVDGQITDITNGEQITAFGTQNGDSFQATSIQIGALGGQNRPGAAPQAPAP